MKKHKIIIIIAMIISIIIILYGFKGNKLSNSNDSKCSITEDKNTAKDENTDKSENKDTLKGNEGLKRIYDDEKAIADKSDDGYFYYSRYQLDSYDKDKISANIIGYYGAVSYWIIDAKEDGKVTLNCNLKFNGDGKYKLLLCDQEKKLFKILEHTSGDSIKNGEITVDVKKGLNRLVAVGNNATLEINLSIKPIGNIEVRETKGNK